MNEKNDAPYKGIHQALNEPDNPLQCPVIATLSLIGGKWKPMVLHILLEAPCRFGAIKKKMAPISQKVLTEQLKELERDGLIHRTQVDGKVISVTYSLSDDGKSLTPILDMLYQWGNQNSWRLQQRRDEANIPR